MNNTTLTPILTDTTPGLRCRKCGGSSFRTIYVRKRPGKVMRRRECLNPACKTRCTTFERAV